MAQVQPCKSHLSDEAKAKRKVVRVLMNGCFDLLHAGHYNALRQSKYALLLRPTTSTVLESPLMGLQVHRSRAG